MSVYIKIIDFSCEFENNQNIEELAKVLCFEEPEMIENSKDFWRDWFSNKYEGEKITIAAEKIDEDNKKFIGVVRLWKTPYCDNKWLVEGLEVITTERRKGIGKTMVEHGINILRDNGIENVFVNIANHNLASIKLHKSLGFNKLSTGSINSFGDFRTHVDQYTLVLKKDLI